MDINIIASTLEPELVNPNLQFTRLKFLTHSAIKEQDTEYELVPRKVSQVEIIIPGRPKWKRSYKITFKDVFQNGSPFGKYPSLDHVDEQEFISRRIRNSSWYPILLTEGTNAPFFIDVAYVGNEIIGGNDPSVLWDSENGRWDFNMY